MNRELETALRKIGMDLDANLFPRVKNGGYVVPSTAIVSQLTLGKECNDVGSKARSEVEPRPWTTARPWPPTGTWPPGRPGAPGSTAPVVLAELRRQYEKELKAVEAAYPGTQYWLTDEGIWLVVESSLLPGLNPKAHFAVAISLDRAPAVRAWGFWGTAAIGFEWIGPRHTNFPDGSICAYDLTDGTWVMGDSLVKLLDLYTVWAVRHLHYRVLGRWPGYQAVPHAYERVLELRPDEFCGCANFQTLYRDCCMERDRSSNLLQQAVRFMLWSLGGLRRPPLSVVKFIQSRRVVPDIETLFV